MKNNNFSNRLIKWVVTAFDFVIMWVILYLSIDTFNVSGKWDEDEKALFWLLCTLSLLIAETRFGTIIHLRQVGGNDILKRTTLLALTFTLLTYLSLRAVRFMSRVGWGLVVVGIVMLAVLLIVRFLERWILKHLRSAGYNTRHITLVGNDEALLKLRDKLIGDSTHGYRVKNHFENTNELFDFGHWQPIANSQQPTANGEQPMADLGEELYLCVPRSERDVIKRISQICDQKMVKFYYVPPTDESLNMESVFIDDIEVFASYVSPLEEPLNRLLKRFCDIVVSFIALIFIALLLPFVAIGIRVQSPGPLLFRQRRTGMDGKEFWCLKFRSMHVNADSDRVQATKDDPRKFPFGNFMRKTNIDELPQFWNVLRGEMSIVGPRPHMLTHTEQYSALIGKYMVRHFVKPGITGWAQVTGFRGETSELWQMEGRVERDIYYIQHWSIWLDLRIVWLTIRNVFKKDENAY